MSSPDEAEGSASSAGFAPECAEGVGTLGFALGTPQGSEGEFPDPERLEAAQGVMEAGGPVRRGCEGRTGSPGDFEGASAAPFGSRGAVAIPQRPANRGARGFRRSPSRDTRDREASSVWFDPEPGPSGRADGTRGWVGSQLASDAPFRLRGPEGDWLWESPKKDARDRPKVPVRLHRPFAEGFVSSPWSDCETSDEFSEMQLMRESVCLKGGGQAKPDSPKRAPRHSRTQAREMFLPAPGPCLSFAPRPLTSCAEGQAVGDAEGSSKKPPGVIWGKAGSRPSYLPLLAAAGSLPMATLGRKGGQETTSLEGASKVAPEFFYHFRGQSGSAAPLDPATFRPLSGVPVFGRGKRHALASFGAKEAPSTGPGQRSVAGSRGSEPVLGEGEDKDLNRDPLPESQSPTGRQRRSFPGGHRGECDAGAVSNRDTQDPAHSEPLALSQGEVLPSGPAPSSDRDPPGQLPRLERQQQPRGAERCPRCPELQREIRDLRQQLAAVRSLADTFRRL